jgi:hypothetical protein
MTTYHPFSELSLAQQERARATFVDAGPSDGYQYVLDTDGVILARSNTCRERSGFSMRLERSARRNNARPVQQAQAMLRAWGQKMIEPARSRTLALADSLSGVNENAERYLYLRNNDQWSESVCEAFSENGNGEHKDLVIDQARGKVRQIGRPH